MTLNQYKNLERLGDAVFRVILIEIFFYEGKPLGVKYTNSRLGKMQSNACMEVIAQKMNIIPHPEDTSKKKYANALEVRIGELYQTSGIEKAKELVREYNNHFYQEFE